MKKILMTVLLCLAEFSYGSSVIKLDCDFLKPELRGSNIKYRADVTIDLTNKKLTLFVETSLGSKTTNWVISKVTDEYFFATKTLPENKDSLLVLDRYKSLLILEDGRVADCKSIDQKF